MTRPPARRSGWSASLSAAGLSLVGLAVVLAVGRVQPFGPRTLLHVDLRVQYAPYIAHLHDVLLGRGGGLGLSWQAGLGSNFVGIFTYYLASPVTLLAALAPASLLPQAIELVIVLKVLLAAALTVPLLVRLVPGRRGPAVVVAAAYSLMSYDIAFAHNLMWLDAMYLLPLLCLALERTLDGRGVAPLALLLAYTTLTCFYLGYTLLLFGGCWLVAGWVRRGSAGGRRALLRHLATYAALCVVAALTSAVLLLPTYLALGHRAAQPGGRHGLFPLDPGPFQLLAQTTTGAFDTVRLPGRPNIGIGFACLVLTILYFAAPGHGARQRRAWGGLGLVIGVALCVPFLTFAWEAFGETNWYMYRFSFLLSFLVAITAYLGLCSLTGPEARPLTDGRALLAALLGLAVVGVAALEHVSTPAWALALDGGLALSLPLLATRTHVGSSRWRTGVPWVALSLVVLDAWTNAGVVAAGALGEFRLLGASRWSAQQDLAPAFARAHELAGPAGRVGNLFPDRTADDPLRYDVPGATLSSTFSNGGVVALEQALGLSGQLPNHIAAGPEGHDPLSDAVLGVGAYVGPPDRRFPGLVLRASVRTGATRTGIFTPLGRPSVGLVMPASTGVPTAPDLGVDQDPFGFGETLLGASAGSLAQQVTPTQVLDDNIRRGRDAAGHTTLALADPGRVGGVTWVLDLPRPGLLSAYLGTRTFASLLFRSQGVLHGYPGVSSHGVLLGGGTRGRQVVSLQLQTPQTVVLETARFAVIDPAAVAARVRALPRLEHVRLGSASVRGDVRVAAAGRLVLSVPFDGGWRADVDGKAVPVRPVAGAFLGVAVPAGAHRVLLRWRAPGLVLGAGLSVLGSCLLLAVVVPSCLRGRRRRAAPQGRLR